MTEATNGDTDALFTAFIWNNSEEKDDYYWSNIFSYKKPLDQTAINKAQKICLLLQAAEVRAMSDLPNKLDNDEYLHAFLKTFSITRTQEALSGDKYAIRAAFEWDRSNEGFYYWNAIYENGMLGKKLDEAATEKLQSYIILKRLFS